MPASATNTAEAGSSRRLAVVAVSRGGCVLGRHLAEALGGDFFAAKGRLAPTMAEVWANYREMVCIMATGIVVRTVAPLLRDKTLDPAVVVCDELGLFAISLLSGHLGGANQLARRVAVATGGQAVLTTASDVLGRTALDLWCRDLGLVPGDKAAFTRAMGRLVDQGALTIWSRYPLPKLPPDLHPHLDRATAELVVDSRLVPGERGAVLHPRSLVVGIGCNRGTAAGAIAAAVESTCATHGLAPRAIARLASIDLKRDEAGLLAYARSQGLDIDFYDKDALNRVEGIAASAIVERATGARAVAEPAALLGAGPGAALLAAKMKWTDVTTAVAEIADPFATTTQGTRTP
ncbi:cobalamin biosynthesis protein [Desulfobulbus sp.]|uniref:cobalt-precorrin 5A hydrolase n=1 Tax=Desulfobulbus sp. TaxID=895 RepID=UPI00286F4DDF|nr:cobalamin biosynthesis protein [Desulfobulbus sp.]